ncbi:MAG: recombinase family protein, partial [Candidatus Pacebacteria bacterium]|nr:recombinase family protein [Candidatus Paceibacterota bacterium]
MRAVILARASSGKQVIEGDALPDQIRQCSNFIKKQTWLLIKVFSLVESGRKKEREFFQEVLDYCKNPKNKINYVVFKNISRFTRGGGRDYLNLKEELQKHGVELRDIFGTIKEQVNTLAPYDLEYEWSTYSPSQAEETYQANRAKDEARDALTRMIGAEIGYVRKGYWNRNPPYGFSNHKIETARDGKRNILVESPKKSFFIKKAFKLKLTGQYSDIEITAKLNSLGFKSRRFCKRDKRTKKVIGYGGENPLTVKGLQRWFQRTVYAGVICEKWTHFQPIKAQFKGLVNIEVFNQVNLGEIRIVKEGDNLQIKYNESPKRRLKNNPLYPFKSSIMCPVCGQPPLGSASTSKSGKKYPAYHCARSHKLWRIPRDKFHQTVYDFVKSIKFNPTFIKLFEKVFLEVWKEKRAEKVSESQKAEEYVAQLLSEQKMALDALKKAFSDIVRKKLESDVEDLEVKIKRARSDRVKKERSEIDIKLAIKYTTYFMEHLGELLINEANPLQQQQLFGLIFEGLPTYNDLVNRTLKLAPIFLLNSASKASKRQLVTPRGIPSEILRVNFSSPCSHENTLSKES